MTFFQSIDFMQALCCILGGIIIGTAAGWTLAGWQERRRERRSRAPRYILPPSDARRDLVTLTCDRTRPGR